MAATLSGLVKTFVQSLLILVIALLFGARLDTSPFGIVGALLVMTLFMAGIVGFANGVALRSKSIGGYHTMLFLMTLPLLFLSNALYPLDAMPVWMRIIAYLNPTTYVVDGLRTTLFSAGSLPFVLCLAVLAVYAVALTYYGVKSFRKVV